MVVSAGVGQAQQPTVLLAFLTTSCAPCQAFWQMLADGAARAALGTEVVVVTPSASMENRRAVQRLTPPGLRAHMASGTWFAYGIARAPSFALVAAGPEGEVPLGPPGRVLGQASPQSPAELVALVRSWEAADKPSRP